MQQSKTKRAFNYMAKPFKAFDQSLKGIHKEYPKEFSIFMVSSSIIGASAILTGNYDQFSHYMSGMMGMVALVAVGRKGYQAMQPSKNANKPS